MVISVVLTLSLLHDWLFAPMLWHWNSCGNRLATFLLPQPIPMGRKPSVVQVRRLFGQVYWLDALSAPYPQYSLMHWLAAAQYT